MKAGQVAIIGRPNSGKSTLINNLIGQKVSITSPKPQTTRMPIQAIFEDKRGQILFIDTPGIFAKVEDPIAKIINPQAEKVLREKPDVIVYLVDHTRERDIEENKILGLVRQTETPKILAINKTDIKKPTFLPHYKFMESEFDKTVQISGLHHQNLNYLMDAIFELLPTGEPLIKDYQRPTAAVNIDSKMYIAEIIREKAFLFTRKEVPYSLTTSVEEIIHRKDNLIYIKAKIITSADRYKKMIIGENGRRIKEIGMAARKELEVATNQRIYLDLTVETNPHWHEVMM